MALVDAGSFQDEVTLCVSPRTCETASLASAGRIPRGCMSPTPQAASACPVLHPKLFAHSLHDDVQNAHRELRRLSPHSVLRLRDPLRPTASLTIMSALDMSLSPTHPVEHASFEIDAILFDMDGTLVDSIQAVEAAWTSVALELGQSPEEVIAATHGRRAIDNLRDLKPKLRRLTNDQMEPHVEEFEQRILREADEFGDKVRSRRSSTSSSRRGSGAVSRRGSTSGGQNPLLPAFGGVNFGMSKIATPSVSDSPIEGGGKTDLETVNDKLARLTTNTESLASPFDDSDDEESDSEIDFTQYTEEEIGCQNKSVRILPGVRRLIDSLPKGRFAVATSGAKTYCHGALLRAGITRPRITITADDPRLLRGKPFPDPFLLAAKELGYPIEKCLVLEDSPSGIKAGVASGAITIAVCTSHPVEKINNCGAHYIVPSLDCVHAFHTASGGIRIVIDAHPPSHVNHGKVGLHVAVAPDGPSEVLFPEKHDEVKVEIKSLGATV